MIRCPWPMANDCCCVPERSTTTCWKLEKLSNERKRLADPPVGSSEARVARAGDQIQPLCAAYGPGVRTIVADRLKASRRSALGLIDALPSITYIETDPRTLTNINTPQEYAALTEAWQQ